MANSSSKTPTINLQDFITEALVQIVEGVKEAQNRVAESGARINPTNTSTENGSALRSPSGYTADLEYGQIVEFDIAVTAADKGDLKGGIGVVSSVINFGYVAEKGSDTSSISRIKFAIPLFLPEQDA